VQRDGKIEAALRELRKNPKLSVSAAAKGNGVNRRTLQDHWQREKDGVLTTDLPDSQQKEVVGTGVAGELLVKAGLDPDEWQVTEVKAAGDPTAAQAKLSIKAVPSDLLDLAAAPYAPLPAPSKPVAGDRSLVFCGDHHAPHQDPGLHEAFCSFLSDEAPAFLGVLGDVGDYASVSRHRAGPGYRQGVKECNQGAYSILYDYRQASPDTQIVLLPAPEVGYTEGDFEGLYPGLYPGFRWVQTVNDGPVPTIREVTVRVIPNRDEGAASELTVFMAGEQS